MKNTKHEYHHFVVQNIIDGVTDYKIKAYTKKEAYEKLIQFLSDINRIKTTKSIVYKEHSVITIME